MTNVTLEAMTTSLSLLVCRLQRAAALAQDAHAAATQGEQNQAIGTLLPAQEQLQDATALLRTVLVLHRAGPQPLSNAATH